MKFLASSPDSPRDHALAPGDTLQQLEALRAENATLRQTLDLMTEAFWAVDRNWTLTAVNAAAERAWGRSRDELLGRHIWELFPEVVGTPNYVAIQQAMHNGIAQSFYDQSPAVHGWVAGRAHPTPNGLIVHFQDVTLVREGDLARQQSEERYRAILESIDEGFCLLGLIFDDDGNPVDYRFLETNPAFEAHTGLHDAIGKTAREMVPDLDPLWWETYGRVALTGEPVRFVDEAQAMEGRWFDVYAFRLGGDDSRVVALLFSNITQRKKMEQLQQDFVAMASHDLAGPVTVLRARAQLMQRRQAYDESSMTAIIEQTQRMERLIDDLRELVRLETGNTTLRQTPIDLPGLAQEAIERMRMQAPQHDLRLQAAAPLEVFADAGRVAQIFDNLLGNAVKYSPEGGLVTVSITAYERHAQVAIADQGLGIAASALPHLFERFFRADARDVAAGLGLGLYITRMLLDAHGGKIWAESTPGEGSTFYFMLPRP